MADEILDLVDKNDNVVGTVSKSVSQGDPNLMYRAVAIAIFNKRCEVLLQQRSKSKKFDPGVWRMSASGHVLAGENPIKSAEREVYEELGINIIPVFFKKELLNVTGKSNLKLPRIFYVYYALHNDDQGITINKNEVETVKWIKIDNLENFSKTNNYDLNDFSHTTILQIAKYLKLI